MHFGNTLSTLRKKKNVTQEEMAAELGVTAAAVSKWENSCTLPDILMLCALADYFDVTTDELLGRTRNLKYAVIAAETEALGRKVAAIARRYGLVARGIYTTYADAAAAASGDDAAEYLVACFFSGYYGEASDLHNLVSVAPNEEAILDAIQRVFEGALNH